MSGNSNNQGGASGSDKNFKPESGDASESSMFASGGSDAVPSGSSSEGADQENSSTSPEAGDSARLTDSNVFEGKIIDEDALEILDDATSYFDGIELEEEVEAIEEAVELKASDAGNEDAAFSFLTDDTSSPTLIGDTSDIYDDEDAEIEIEEDDEALAILNGSNAPTLVGSSDSLEDDEEEQAEDDEEAAHRLLLEGSNAPTLIGDTSDIYEDEDAEIEIDEDDEALAILNGSNAPTLVGSSDSLEVDEEESAEEDEEAARNSLLEGSNAPTLCGDTSDIYEDDDVEIDEDDEALAILNGSNAPTLVGSSESLEVDKEQSAEEDEEAARKALLEGSNAPTLGGDTSDINEDDDADIDEDDEALAILNGSNAPTLVGSSDSLEVDKEQSAEEDEEPAHNSLLEGSNAPTLGGETSDILDADDEDAERLLSESANATTLSGESSLDIELEDQEEEPDEIAAQFLKDPSNAPTFAGDSSDGHNEDELLKAPSNAPTFVSDSSDGGAENELLEAESNAPTFLGDSSAENHANFYSQSLGRNADSDPGSGTPVEGKKSGSKEAKNPRRLSSLIAGAESRFGLDSSLKIRNRPVTGGGPFGDSPDADYMIVKELAKGGMGIVYTARQLSLNRELAIKTLKPIDEKERKKLSQNRMSQLTRFRCEMFLSEALITANLVHPNIVPIHDLCQSEDGTPFYSMKQVEGVPWNKVIKTKSMEENIEVLLKVADAVAYAHHNGVINRDLKPENIMLGEFGEVIVLDWGLAVRAPDSVKPKFAAPPASLQAGTPAYMAPELWAGPIEKISRGSDIYLLGAILYEMLVGHPPHAFANPAGRGQATVHQIIDSVLRPNAIVPTQIKGELMDIAKRAMENDPDDRYPTVQEFQAAIRNYQRHEESRTLTNRADDLVQGKAGSKSEGYSDYQTACALYEEALRGWDGNEKAEEGLFHTQLKYAELAHNRGDYDLGLQMVGNRDSKEFVTLREKLTKAKVRRGRQKMLTTASIVAFLLAVIGGGSVSTYFWYESSQRYEQLVAANGNLAKAKSLTSEAEQKAADARIAQANADAAAVKAKAEQVAAVKLKEDAERLAMTETAKAMKAADDATKANMETMTAKMEATVAKNEAVAAKMEATVAKNEAAKATMEATKATEAAAIVTAAAKQSVLEATLTSEQVQVTSLVRAGSFDKAIKALNSLLESEELKALPEELKTRRIREIQEQKKVLEEKSVLSDDVTQVMAVTSDEKYFVWGKGDGSLELWENTSSGQAFSSTPVKAIELMPGQQVVDLRITGTGADTIAIAACGSKIFFWNLNSEQLNSVSAQNGNTVKAIEVSDKFVFAALENNQNGLIGCWNISDLNRNWEYPTGTGVQDLALIPGSDVLIYAGSRAGLSADVVAIRVGIERPKEPIGQMKYTAQSLSPPRCIAVSPGGDFLVVGNSRDGEILILPKANSTPENGTNSFPFQSPADITTNDSWSHLEHARPITSIAFDSTGTLMLTGSEDRTAGVWTITKKADQATAVVFDSERRLTKHGAPVTSAVFVGTANQTAMTASLDRYCRLWDLKDFDTQMEIDRALEPAKVSLPTTWLHDEDKAVQPAPAQDSVSYNRAMLLQLARPVPTVLPSDVPVTTDSPGDRLTVLNGAKAKQLQGPVSAADLSADGRVAVLGGIAGTAVLWDTQKGEVIQGPAKETGVAEQENAASTLKPGLFHDRGNLFEEGHKFNMSRLTFLPPDSKLMLTSSFDGSVCLWNSDPTSPQFGTERARLTATRLLNAFAVSRSGEFLVTTIESETPAPQENVPTEEKPFFNCAIWTLATLTSGVPPLPQKLLSGFHRQDVTAVSVSPDDARIATSDRDGNVAVWSAESGQLLRSFRAHPKLTFITGLEWLSDSSLVTAGLDGEMKVWSIPAETSAVSASDKIAAAFAFRNDRSIIDRLLVSPDRQQLLSISVNQRRKGKETVQSYEVRLWKIGTPQTLGSIQLAASEFASATPPVNFQRSITSVTWSDDGKKVAVVVKDTPDASVASDIPESTVQIVDTETWKVVEVLSCSQLNISDVAISSNAAAGADGGLVATFDGTAAHLWQFADGEHRVSCRPQQSVSALALSRDPAHSVLAMGTDSLLLFNSSESPAFGQTLAKTALKKGHRISSLEFSPVAGDFRIASGSLSADSQGLVQLWSWDPMTQQLAAITSIEGNGGVMDVKWTADASSLLMVRPSSASLLDVASGVQTELPLPAASAGIALRCGSISPKGDAIALAGELADQGSFGFVLRKNADSEFKLHSEFAGHGFGGITGLEFIPPVAADGDSPYLVSTGADGAAILWNWHPEKQVSPSAASEAFRFIARGRQVTDAHRGPIRDLAVTAGGLLVTCSDDGTAIVWRNPLAGL